MKNKIIYLWLFFFILLWFDLGMITYKYMFNRNTQRSILIGENTSYTLFSGEVLSVKLLSRPGTGYQWTAYTYNKNVLQPERQEYEYLPWEDAELVGQELYQVFNFSAKRSGHTLVEFEYKRPWGKDKPVSKKIILEFIVND